MSDGIVNCMSISTYIHFDIDSNHDTKQCDLFQEPKST